MNRRLSVKQLSELVKCTISEQRAVDVLREEIARVLGPSVIVENCGVSQLAVEANERIDVLDRTGRSSRMAFKPSVMVSWLSHSDAEVRKLAARTVPEKFLQQVVNDKNPSVRAAVARRLPLNAVSEMLKKFPKDDHLHAIYRQRKLNEADGGLPYPSQEERKVKVHLGDVAKQDPGPELSDLWYQEQAIRFVMDYGANMEDCWEDVLAHRYCSSVKATRGVEIDERKLLKAIQDELDARRERAYKRNAIKETVERLNEWADDEMTEYAVTVAPCRFAGTEEDAKNLIAFESDDSVEELVSSDSAPAEFIEEANIVFCVKESTVPGALRKHSLKSNKKPFTVPVSGRLPHNNGFRAVDERALDMYCEAWNTRQQFNSERLSVSWMNHPDGDNKISFSVTLK